MTPTKKQLDTLRHMLGINDRFSKEPKPCRDYYAAPLGDVEMWQMAEAGFVERYATTKVYEWYRTTPAGRSAAMASHKEIRFSKAQRTYAKFMSVRDCWPDLTFRQFLTHPALRDARKSA